VTLSTGEFSMQRYVFYVNPRRKVTGNTAGYIWVAGFLLSVEMGVMAKNVCCFLWF